MDADNRGVPCARIGAEPLRQLSAAELGQIGAQNHHVGGIGERHTQRRDAVRGFGDAEACFIEQCAQLLARPPIVVRDKDADELHSGHLDRQYPRDAKRVPWQSSRKAGDAFGLTAQRVWAGCRAIVGAGRRRRGPYATSPPRLPRDLPSFLTMAPSILTVADVSTRG